MRNIMKNILSTIYKIKSNLTSLANHKTDLGTQATEILLEAPSLQHLIPSARNNLQEVIQNINNIQTITEELNGQIKDELANTEEKIKSYANHNYIINSVNRVSEVIDEHNDTQKELLVQIAENLYEIRVLTPEANGVLDEVMKVVGKIDLITEEERGIMGDELQYVIDEVEHYDY